MDITPTNTQALFNANRIPTNTFIHIKPREAWTALRCNNGRMLSGIVRDCRVYPDQIVVFVSDLYYAVPEQIDSPSPSAPKLKQLLNIIHNHEPGLVDEIYKGVDPTWYENQRPIEREHSFNWPNDRLILPAQDPRARRLMEAPVLVPANR